MERPYIQQFVAPTTKECTILRLTARGQTYEQAAETLQVTAQEVCDTLKRLQTQVGVSSPHALIALAAVYRWI